MLGTECHDADRDAGIVVRLPLAVGDSFKDRLAYLDRLTKGLYRMLEALPDNRPTHFLSQHERFAGLTREQIDEELAEDKVGLHPDASPIYETLARVKAERTRVWKLTRPAKCPTCGKR